MITTIEAQFMSLIISVFAGIAAGILFDLYRTINYFTRPKKALVHFMDLLFWITTSVVVFSILLNADFAMIRIYTVMGIGLGVLIYFKLFSEYILIFYRWLFYIVGKFFRILVIMVTIPFKLIYNVTWRPVNGAKKAVISFFKYIWKLLRGKIKKNK